jgi:hypothetical protein
MEIDMSQMIIRAKALLEANPKCWVERELSYENPYCARARANVPGKLQGPDFPDNLQYDHCYNSESKGHPLFNAAKLWAMQIRENSTCILMAGDVVWNCETLFMRQLDGRSTIRCFKCQISEYNACICKCCKLCGSKNCSMDCYADDGMTY